MITSGMTLKWY